MSVTAASRLEYGDDINRRLAGGDTVASIAAADGVSPQAVAKASWLARTYGPAVRVEIGPSVLSALTPSHLEVAARLDATTRTTLLHQADDCELSVRRLRQAAGLTREPARSPAARSAVNVIGSAKELASASVAVRGYTAWDDRALRALLGGPNGTVVRDLASAGRELASRIEEVMPRTPTSLSP